MIEVFDEPLYCYESLNWSVSLVVKSQHIVLYPIFLSIKYNA